MGRTMFKRVGLKARHMGFALFLLAHLPGAMQAEKLESQALFAPTPDSWPLYHGDYTGKRHSPLTQVTPQNVGELDL